MENLSYRAHFSQIGWTQKRNFNEPILFVDLKIEAVQIILNHSNIRISVWNKEGKLCSDGDGIAGTTGKKLALFGIAVDCEDETEIFYRVYQSKNGWSEFVSQGKTAGEEFGEEAICGIQIFIRNNQVTYEEQVRNADHKLQKYECIQSNLFVDNKWAMLEHLTKEYKDDREEEIGVYENAFILPLKKLENSKVRNAVYCGGVMDENMNFIAGQDRKAGKNVNLSCLEGYQPETVLRSDEIVILGGRLSENLT